MGMPCNRKSPWAFEFIDSKGTTMSADWLLAVGLSHSAILRMICDLRRSEALNANVLGIQKTVKGEQTWNVSRDLQILWPAALLVEFQQIALVLVLRHFSPLIYRPCYPRPEDVNYAASCGYRRRYMMKGRVKNTLWREIVLSHTPGCPVYHDE